MKLIYSKRIEWILLPSFNKSSAFEFAEIVRNNAAEFGRYVSNVADSSIKGLIIP